MGDFNADGKVDLALASTGTNSVSILLGNGDGTFTIGSSPRTGLQPYSVAVADFNGDGKLDPGGCSLRRERGLGATR